MTHRVSRNIKVIPLTLNDRRKSPRFYSILYARGTLNLY